MLRLSSPWKTMAKSLFDRVGGLEQATRLMSEGIRESVEEAHRMGVPTYAAEGDSLIQTNADQTKEKLQHLNFGYSYTNNTSTTSDASAALDVLTQADRDAAMLALEQAVSDSIGDLGANAGWHMHPPHQLDAFSQITEKLDALIKAVTFTIGGNDDAPFSKPHVLSSIQNFYFLANNSPERNHKPPKGAVVIRHRDNPGIDNSEMVTWEIAQLNTGVRALSRTIHGLTYFNPRSNESVAAEELYQLLSKLVHFRYQVLGISEFPATPSYLSGSYVLTDIADIAEQTEYATPGVTRQAKSETVKRPSKNKQ